MKLTVSQQTGPQIPQELIGLFYEDINFAGDGGLYAEMIENRSFEAKEAFGTPGYFYAVDDFDYAWKPYTTTGDLPRMQIVSGAPVSSENPHYLRLTAGKSGDGFCNKAYDGIHLEAEKKYKIRFFARPVTFTGSSLTVRVEKNGRIYANETVTLKPVAPYMPFSDLKLTSDQELPDDPWNNKIREAQKYLDDAHLRQNHWELYELTLSAFDTVRGAKFVIVLNGSGAIEFDFISMIPEDAVAGVFRKDLFEALKELHPGFIRFPGGCIIEGISLDNRYQWKKSVGKPWERKYTQNLWGFEDNRFVEGADVKRPDSHYGMSYGLGYYEFFLLCELLGAKPLPVLNIGAACQFRSTEIVPVDAPEFKEYLQDALDLIEFANGPVDSRWGSLRARMGHPESFHMDMMGIGNEQWETKFLNFYDRYLIFEKAIHEVAPEMRLIGSAGPDIAMPTAEEAWEFYRNEEAKKPGFSYAVDEHYYKPVEWMYDHYSYYDSYPRSVGVFAGEYAGHPTDRENTMVGALSEAALLCGIEKNADVVKLASYAPLFNNINHSQWQPDMIWFDDADVFVTPSYQVQKLFAENLGQTIIPMGGQELALAKEGIYVSLSRRSDGALLLKAVNANETDCSLELDGAAANSSAKQLLLRPTGPRPEKRPEPTEIAETAFAFDGSVSLPAKSFCVFIL